MKGTSHYFYPVGFLKAKQSLGRAWEPRGDLSVWSALGETSVVVEEVTHEMHTGLKD